MPLSLRSSAPAALLVTGLVLVSGTSGAVAGGMITGQNIKNNTVASVDIKDLSLKPSDTSKQLDAYLQRVAGYQAVHRSAVVAPGDGGVVNAACPGETSILGSAAWWTASSSGPQVEVSADDGYTKTATAYDNNTRPSDDTMHLTLFCGRTAG
jgi:hypothetical protein